MRRCFPESRPFFLTKVQVNPVAWAAACLCVLSGSAWAQNVELSVQLKPSSLLQEKFTPEQVKGMPTFVFGDRITGRPEIDTVIEGHAELRRNGVVLKADRIEYYQPDDLAKVRGNVYVNRNGDVYQGKEGQLRVDAQEGYFLEPRFRLLKNNARGQASRIDFVDEQRSVARDGTYSVWHSEPGVADSSDWVIRGSQVRIDNETDVGEATAGRLEFMGVPVLALPYLSFPLSNQRKSGWLPPGINVDNVSGLELVVPYYANLAPNRDLTLYPTILSRRGLNVGTEFRYLERDYVGMARLDFMPSDRLRGRNRWGLSGSHNGTLDTGYQGIGSLSLGVTLNRVSDDDYWRDFPRASGSLTQRLLANDAVVTWTSGDWSVFSRALKWQTLQQAASTITPPYDRLPQINGRYSRQNHAGFDYSIELDTTRFQSLRALTLQPNAHRSFAQLQLSKQMTSPGGFLVPKLQLHSTAYAFDAALTAGPLAGRRSASRFVPTVSLDSGLIFERSAAYWGRSFTQTLEPRIFYTYTPFKDQSSLPIYDSGATDFNFATIFNENAFTGVDRIADNNLVTVGLTSRLVDPGSGAEVVRLSYAQRLRLRDQLVTLPGGLADTSRLSDMLFGATINWNRHWLVDSTVQYRPSIRRSQRSTVSARYSPTDYRVLSATYRLNRGVSEQIDVGWQWPINDLWGDRGKQLGVGRGQGKGRWYSVGRLNFSLKDNKQVDTVLGVEYDGGSWLARTVFERLQTTTSSANKRILFQLEFVGFARVGSNPLSTLRSNIPQYQMLRDKIDVSPSRFSNYE
jgi:LPS-assembly protein